LVLLALLSLAAAGCSYKTTGNEPGTLTVNNPLRLPASPAPARPAEGAAAALPALPRSGTYAGFAFATANPGGLCSTRLRIDRFFVNGDRVVFGAFRGTIQPDGNLRMQVGPSYVFGRFQGDRFEGQFRRAGPNCPFRIELERVSD
jgi:hypothetical protein